jgi:glutathione S-transferase
VPVENLVVVVTLASLLVYFWTCMRVATARARNKIVAPAVTGHPEFERAYRVQINTLEWLPLYLPSLWLFAYYLSATVAAAVGLLWILGRILYALSYVKDPTQRALGFGLQALATAVLFIGSLGKAVVLLAMHGSPSA